MNGNKERHNTHWKQAKKTSQESETILEPVGNGTRKAEITKHAAFKRHNTGLPQNRNAKRNLPGRALREVFVYGDTVTNRKRPLAFCKRSFLEYILFLQRDFFHNIFVDFFYGADFHAVGAGDAVPLLMLCNGNGVIVGLLEVMLVRFMDVLGEAFF